MNLFRLEKLAIFNEIKTATKKNKSNHMTVIDGVSTANTICGIETKIIIIKTCIEKIIQQSQ